MELFKGRRTQMVCPHIQPQQLFLYQIYAQICASWGCTCGERCCRAVHVQICDCADAQHTPEAFSLPACFFPPKLLSPVCGTKPAVERFSKSALLCRRKRYFNSAVNKFCPFTCVRNTLNKLRFQDLAPRHWPNKSGLTARGEGRGPRGTHILHKMKSLPEP